jgi:hypothetical protein
MKWKGAYVGLSVSVLEMVSRFVVKSVCVSASMFRGRESKHMFVRLVGQVQRAAVSEAFRLWAVDETDMRSGCRTVALWGLKDLNSTHRILANLVDTASLNVANLATV